jgi:uncharacterized protein (TIGR03083 family)
MDRAEYLAAIRREGMALADAAEGHLAARVPSCPDWTVSDLVFHVAGVHRFWGEVVRRRARDAAAVDRIRPTIDPSDDELLTWYRSGLERLGDTLAAADPSLPMWTWTPSDERVAWVLRRMAQETAVHRVDAQLAAGIRHPSVEPPLAADGVDEFFTYFLPDGDGLAGPAQTVRLQADDVDRSWLVTAGDGELVVVHETGGVDAQVQAPASDLLLVLWRREDADRLRVTGDREQLARFLARAELE